MPDRIDAKPQKRGPLPRTQTHVPASADRRFLFLQGPHGPFFARLAEQLIAAGVSCLRVGFNAGDRRFWTRKADYIPWTGTPEAWRDSVGALMHDHAITDLVIYSDCRPVHSDAVAAARAAGITVHVFEEGYLRPYWVTYERGGSNGNSRLMSLQLDQMRRALEQVDADQPEAPVSWGDLRQHIYFGALYHFHVMLLNKGYPGFRTHRDRGVRAEFRQYLRRLLAWPVIALERSWKTWKIRRGGFPYHLVLMQLEHDSSFRNHSPFRDAGGFLGAVIGKFAEGAPRHHKLVVKSHPLEDGSAQLPRLTARLAAAHGVSDRVIFVPGGKLARLLDLSRSVVTVNSTAAQQALWRGLPVKAFGHAVYSKPELVSDQPLCAFFNAPQPPDSQAYRDFRRFLLDTSQIPGGFYSTRGRSRLLQRIGDMMLADRDPYDALLDAGETNTARLRVVK